LTNLTIDIIRDALHKMGPAYPHQEIKCGNMDEFIHAVKRRTGQEIVKTSKTCAYFCGVEVQVSPHVPIDKAVVIVDGMAKGIIDLRGQ